MSKEKAYKYKQASKKYKKKKTSCKDKIQKHAYVLTMLFFSLVIVVCLYFISDYSHVKSMSVSGNKEVTDQEILENIAVQPGDSMYEVFLTRRRINQHLLSRIPQLEKVKLNWKGVNNVEVEVKELATIAYVDQEAAYHQILENGDILSVPIDIPKGPHPVLIDFEGDELNEMVEELKNIDAPVRQLISEIAYTPSKINSKKITIYMKDGNQVIALYSNVSKRLNYYPSMLEAIDHREGVFNLETGAYFTPYERSKEGESDGELDDETSEGQSQTEGEEASEVIKEEEESEGLEDGLNAESVSP